VRVIENLRTKAITEEEEEKILLKENIVCIIINIITL